MRNGPLTFFLSIKYVMRAMVWMVLPSPISSARIPFRLLLNSETSHSRPCNKCMGNTIQYSTTHCNRMLRFTFLFCINDILMYLRLSHDHLLPYTFQLFIHSHYTLNTVITVNLQSFMLIQGKEYMKLKNSISTSTVSHK